MSDLPPEGAEALSDSPLCASVYVHALTPDPKLPQDTVRELGPIPDVAFVLHTGDNARSTNLNLFRARDYERGAPGQPDAWGDEPHDASQGKVPLPVGPRQPPTYGDEKVAKS